MIRNRWHDKGRGLPQESEEEEDSSDTLAPGTLHLTIEQANLDDSKSPDELAREYDPQAERKMSKRECNYANQN